MTGLEELELPETATTEDVQRRYRALALLHHPDRGGDTVAFQKLVASYKRAMQEAAVPLVCAACNGSGRRVVMQGFSSIALSCAACGGSGQKARGEA